MVWEWGTKTWESADSVLAYNKQVGVDLILNCFRSSAGGEYIKSVKFALVHQFVCHPWKLQAGSVRLEI